MDVRSPAFQKQEHHLAVNYNHNRRLAISRIGMIGISS